jgi:hypothetical protein
MRDMNLRTLSVTSGLSAFLVLAVTTPGMADTYLRQRKHTSAHEFMGKNIPNRGRTITTWMTKDRIRMDEDTEESIIILDDKNMIYFVDHVEKTFVEVSVGDYDDGMSSTAAGSDTGLSERKEAAGKQITNSFFSTSSLAKVTVTDLDESKRLKDWKCRKYLLHFRMPMGSSSIEIWASEDIKADYRLYNKISNLIILIKSYSQDALREIEKIRGFPVYSVEKSEHRGLTRTTIIELIEIDERTPPEGTYRIPFGYKRISVR